MMDFALNEEQKLFRKVVRYFAEKEIMPRAQEIDEKGEFPWDIIHKMADLGLMGLPFPEEYGGAGMDFTSFIIIMEEVSRACGSTGITLAAHSSLCAYPLFKFGSEEHKQKYLPDICTGKKLGAFGLTEAEAGSDAGATKTTAVKQDDHWVINGSKMFCTTAARPTSSSLRRRPISKRDPAMAFPASSSRRDFPASIRARTRTSWGFAEA